MAGMTPDDIAEGRRLLSEATPGWAEIIDGGLFMLGLTGNYHLDDVFEEWPDDAALIVWLRNHAELLLSEIERLRGEVHKVYTAVDLLTMIEGECSTEECQHAVLRHPRTVGPVHCNVCRAL